MLQSIHIENIALIKKLDIDLSPAFCAFTGETGAGKSIIIDSIGVLCGGKVSKELIRNGEDYLTVEGVFCDVGVRACEKCRELGIELDEDGLLYISRTVKTDGKGVVRIGTKQVPLSILKELSPLLINIHGQHDNQELLVKEKHRKLLDFFAENEEIYNEYNTLFAEYCSIKRSLDEINVDESEKLRRIEMLKFQINDISLLKLKKGEEDELIEEKKKLLNIEKLAKNATIVSESLFGSNGVSACDCIDRAVDALRNLSKISDDYSKYIDTLNDIKSELIDIAETVDDGSYEEYSNPGAVLDKIENRLDEITKAKRKYGGDIESVLEYLDKAKNELDELENYDRHSEKLRIRLSECGEKVKRAGAKLTESRINAGDKLKNSIEKQLKYLDMPGVKFKVSINTKAFSKDGADDVEFFIMTNSGEGYSPLSKTASGGELSRIMLAIKSVIAEKDGVDTLIFDEVDTGISGKTSRKIGLMMSDISKVSQVLCVTHSAQICSVADSHYLVSKHTDNDRTVTNVNLLSYDDRIHETARIIAGIDITESSLSAAKELIDSKTL
ncbi:MAG: DNA repair protein RecN [Ruminococcaceae bacterium]|nr:DNA repair protein RecN [Oscillospiraceae bacterium]